MRRVALALALAFVIVAASAAWAQESSEKTEQKYFKWQKLGGDPFLRLPRTDESLQLMFDSKSKVYARVKNRVQKIFGTDEKFWEDLVTQVREKQWLIATFEKGERFDTPMAYGSGITTNPPEIAGDFKMESWVIPMGDINVVVGKDCHNIVGKKPVPSIVEEAQKFIDESLSNRPPEPFPIPRPPRLRIPEEPVQREPPPQPPFRPTPEREKRIKGGTVALIVAGLVGGALAAWRLGGDDSVGKIDPGTGRRPTTARSTTGARISIRFGR